MKELEKSAGPEKNAQDTFLFWKTGFVGIALILSGLFFLFTNFILAESEDLSSRYIGIFFFIAGIIFAFFQGGGRGLFWFIIPGGVAFTSGIITVVFGIYQLFSLLTLIFFCFGLAVTFLLIFLLRKTAWWALLPAGALAGVSAWISLATVQSQIGFHPVALIFFIGVAFLAIYFFSVQKSKMWFALITGLIIVAFAVFYYLLIIFHEYTLFWAVLLVCGGIIFPFAVHFIEKRAKKKNELFKKNHA
jgi:hypothetical protein